MIISPTFDHCHWIKDPILVDLLQELFNCKTNNSNLMQLSLSRFSQSDMLNVAVSDDYEMNKTNDQPGRRDIIPVIFLNSRQGHIL